MHRIDEKANAFGAPILNSIDNSLRKSYTCAMASEDAAETKGESKTKEQTDWHRLLGALLHALLSMVGIIVQIEVPLVRKALKLDILLLRRTGRAWTLEQLTRLPDGIRQRPERHILCEFKYTESVNHDALVQTLHYEMLYRTENEIKEKEIATFLISAQTPQDDTLARYGYAKSDLPGVYRSQQDICKRVELLVLNELSNEVHNAFFKCFASRSRAREAAFHLLERVDASLLSETVWSMIAGLRSLLQGRRKNSMENIVLTPEYVQSLGEGLRRMVINSMTIEDRLEGLAPKERLEGLAPKERLEGLAPEVVIAQYAPETVIAQFAPEELLAGLDPAVIEDYLRRHKQSTNRTSDSGKTKPRRPRKAH